jgi:hypothetical protein
MDHQSSAREVLVRLLHTQWYSLPAYLRGASPWAHPGAERVIGTFGHIAADQQALGARIAAHLVRQYEVAPRGGFPARFTAFNDLSIDYLIGMLIEQQRATIGVIEACAGELRGDPAGRALAEEALGAARGHLESLVEAKDSEH